MSHANRPMAFCFGLALLLVTRLAGRCLYAQDNAAVVVVAPQQVDVARRVIDVTCPDGVFVDKPLARMSSYDKAVALENSQRVHAILTRTGSAAAVTGGTAPAVVTKIRQLMETQGVQRHQESGLAYYSSYGDLYDWELYFDSVLLAYFGGEEYAVQGLRIFLSKQQANGFVPRRVPKRPAVEELDRHAHALYAEERQEHCKPFLFQVALIIARTRASVEWITPADYGALRSYLTHWLEQWDADGNGLCEWSSAPHSGADTQLERVGPWGSRYCEGTDLNCFLYRELLAASYIARALGNLDDARAFADRAQRTAEAVRSILWDDSTAMFLDRDARDGTRIAVKSAATFLPLAARIATPQQACALVERHLRNTAEFATPFPVPSYARNELAYAQRYEPTDGAPPVLGIQSGHANWCGGMWPHWTMQISHGLQDYGFDRDARLLADQLFQALAVPAGFYEWYDAETGTGCGLNPFWAGATVLGAMLPAELASRFNPMEPRPVEWTGIGCKDALARADPEAPAFTRRERHLHPTARDAARWKPPRSRGGSVTSTLRAAAIH